MATLFRDPRTAEFDVLAIQEPWRNLFMAITHYSAKDRFHLCYPEKTEGEPAKVCFFINKKLDHIKWQFQEYSKDICTWVVEIEGNSHDFRIIAIYNIYNPGRIKPNKQNILCILRGAL
jgi:hypothetical protein